MILRFGVATAAERLNAFHKVDALIETLVRFRAGLAAEADLYVERRRGSRAGPEVQRFPRPRHGAVARPTA